MRNIHEAREYVRHCTKMCKQKAGFNTYTEEQYLPPTFMLLLTTEAKEKYLAKNKFYQQALNEVFDKYMQFYISSAKRFNTDIIVHDNKQYEMLFVALRCFQALDNDNSFYDDITVVNATKFLVNSKLLHDRFLDIALNYSEQEKVRMLRVSAQA